MQDRHKNKEKYFLEQAHTTEKYVIPYIQELLSFGKNTNVLEIGCGEAGNLKPFIELGCKATGIDISCSRIELARSFYKNHPQKENLELICEDIYKADFKGKTFDLIIMRDVIEHIPNQEIFMKYVKTLMNQNTKFFLGFPPWQNPFGGHQQICQNKFLSKLPYFHLLPGKIYKSVLKVFEKDERRIENLMEIKATGISIDRFERILKNENYKIDKRTFFFINPNYETKFGFKPKKQNKLISAIPGLRNFFTTAAYYVISK